MVWKQVEKPYKETTIKKTTLVEETTTKDTFSQDFLKTMNVFREHAARVTAQYTNVLLLKENLNPTEVTCQMDFAKNYVCNFGEEVSSASYSKQQITVHPAVFHNRETMDAPLQHKSVVILNEDDCHTAPTVFAFLKAKGVPSWWCFMHPLH